MSRTKRKRNGTPQDDDQTFAILRPHEVASMLGLRPDTLRKWRTEGRGPKFIRETARSCVYRKEAILQWLKDNETNIQPTYRRAPRAKPKPKPKRTTRGDDSSPAKSESPGA